MVQLYGVVCWSYAVGCCIVYGSTLIYYINKLFFAIIGWVDQLCSTLLLCTGDSWVCWIHDSSERILDHVATLLHNNVNIRNTLLHQGSRVLHHNL
jgi:hypothetical protein